jgi:hypothetical protein
MMKAIVEIDWKHRRVRILHQRIHHGPVGILGGTALLLWGLSDWHDIDQWFVRGPQL